MADDGGWRIIREPTSVLGEMMAGSRTKSKPRRKPDPKKAPRRAINAIEVEEASIILGMASDPQRVSILVALADGEAETAELAGFIGQEPEGLSHSLAHLRLADLISSRRIGDKAVHSLTAKGWALARFLGCVVSTVEQLGAAIDPKLLSDVGEVTDDPERWFHTPNSVFEGRKPVELLGTPDEPRLRNRIEAARQGMFS